jgi:phosphoenolpyruvate phosphomutase
VGPHGDTHCKTSVRIKEPGALKVVGAHDALSAHLIKRAGFDGVWGSGFAISTSLKCIPDASFITSSEQLDVGRNIVETVSIPVSPTATQDIETR